MSETIERSNTLSIKVELPPPFLNLLEPLGHNGVRFRLYYGGRGSAKSTSIAIALILRAMQGKPDPKRPGCTMGVRILCAREYQSSIDESVHYLLKSWIGKLGLLDYFRILDHRIICKVNGSTFIFAGLHHKVHEIKSKDSLDICWVEEAATVARATWRDLIPTIREANSELWASWNPIEEDDPIYELLVKPNLPDAIVHKVNWRDNPWFENPGSTMATDRKRDLKYNPEEYDHIWEGEPRTRSTAQIMRGKYIIEDFETPVGAVFYHGADWGFSVDPTVLVRCYIAPASNIIEGYELAGEPGDNDLWIDAEAYGHGVDFEFIPDLFMHIPTARDWQILADNSRPDTISFVRRQGFMIAPARKWSGSVEDGISHLRGFRKIHVHTRCVNVAREMRKYSYRVDRRTEQIMPVIVDAENHCMDALRYALDGFIKARGTLGIWERLAEG